MIWRCIMTQRINLCLLLALLFWEWFVSPTRLVLSAGGRERATTYSQIGARKRWRRCLESQRLLSTEYGICWVIHFPIMWRYRVWLSVMEWSDEDSVAVSHRLFYLHQSVPFSVIFILIRFHSFTGIAFWRTPTRKGALFLSPPFGPILSTTGCRLFTFSHFCFPSPRIVDSQRYLASHPRYGFCGATRCGYLLPLSASHFPPSLYLSVFALSFFIWWQV